MPVTRLPLAPRFAAVPDDAKHLDHLLNVGGIGENQSALARGLDQRSNELGAGDCKAMLETDIDRNPIEIGHMPVQKYNCDLGPRVSLYNRGARFIAFRHREGLYCPNSNIRYSRLLFAYDNPVALEADLESGLIGILDHYVLE